MRRPGYPRLTDAGHPLPTPGSLSGASQALEIASSNRGHELLVVLLSAYHGWLVRYGKKLARGGERVGGRTLRLMNEIPGIAVVLIVVLVIVRPF